MAQRSSRAPLYFGLAAAGGVGYYLYSAGGSPKVAEKQFETDLSRASAKVKSEIPGRATQAQKEAEKWGSEAGAKLDSATNQARAELGKAEGKFDQYKKDADQYRKEAAQTTMKKIDEVDRKVEAEAAKAKSGISSWFGGK
ncbi:hypothetical protein SBOR_2050 [Sclerotinia borealis F-4128]|uniref:Calcofluor white hypersensitive protein n=1 Tax=Sclerotinia borealis (strain F-4128) TaxID=1432307 RepID=W9CN89_SCLBF|nr:hypothetical protein SBOR_2050 [Sclerotinia borealis F-4128]